MLLVFIVFVQEMDFVLRSGFGVFRVFVLLRALSEVVYLLKSVAISSSVSDAKQCLPNKIYRKNVPLSGF